MGHKQHVDVPRPEAHGGLKQVGASFSLFLASVVLQLDPIVPALVWPLMFSDICSSLADLGVLKMLVFYVSAYTIPISSITPVLRSRMQEAPAATVRKNIVQSLLLYGAGLGMISLNNNTWWPILVGRATTGIAAAGLYAALPVAAEIMAQTGPVTSATLVSWNMLNAKGASVGRMAAVVLAALMSVDTHWRYITAAGIPVCLLGAACGFMLPSTSTDPRSKRTSLGGPDGALSATLALITLQLYVVATSTISWGFLLEGSSIALRVFLGCMSLCGLAYAVYCFSHKSILVLNRFMGIDSLTSIALGSLTTIITHFGLWYAQASALNTATLSGVFFVSVLSWSLGHHAAGFPVDFPSISNYLSAHDLLMAGGCLTLFGCLMAIYHMLGVAPLHVSFWIGVCGFGVGLLNLYLINAPVRHLRKQRSKSLELSGLGRSDVVGFTQSNHFGQLVGMCAANRVFTRYFGVMVRNVHNGDLYATEIIGLVEAKQALVATEYFIPDAFPGIPAVFRPPILHAMGLALGVAIPMAAVVLAGSFFRHDEYEASDECLAGFLTVLPEIDNELPVWDKLASDGEKSCLEAAKPVPYNPYGTF